MSGRRVSLFALSQWQLYQRQQSSQNVFCRRNIYLVWLHSKLQQMAHAEEFSLRLLIPCRCHTLFRWTLQNNLVFHKDFGSSPSTILSRGVVNNLVDRSDQFHSIATPVYLEFRVNRAHSQKWNSANYFYQATGGDAANDNSAISIASHSICKFLG